MNRMNSGLYHEISNLIRAARTNVRTAVNTTMVMTYWNIGRLIINDEQKGEIRAEYGKAVLKELSQQLTEGFGKGFTTTNLKYMRLFYQLFPNGHALSDHLNWTHYRNLLRVENKDARIWYMQDTDNVIADYCKQLGIEAPS